MKSADERAWQSARDFGIDVTLLEASLLQTPAQRLAELVAMNRLHDELRARTLSPEQLEALDVRELTAKFGALLDETDGLPRRTKD